MKQIQRSVHLSNKVSLKTKLIAVDSIFIDRSDQTISTVSLVIYEYGVIHTIVEQKHEIIDVCPPIKLLESTLTISSRINFN